MKIALAQINPTVGDFSGNVTKILDFAERAQKLQADLVIVPELAICGYPPADLLEKDAFIEQAGEALAVVRVWTTGLGRPAVLCGCVMSTEKENDAPSVGKQVRNVAVLMARGEVTAVQGKMLLPFYDVFDEQRYFEPALEQSLTTLAALDQCGKPEYEVPLAITICEDAWNDKGFWPRRRYAVDPVERLMSDWDEQPESLRQHPRIILNISASPFWQGKRAVRREMLSALACRHGAYVAMVNQVGGNDSLVFDGTSLAIGPDGEVIAQARSFEEDLILFDTNGNAGVSQVTGEIDKTVDTEVKATWDALVLGTRDYVRKCGFSKALVGLSGGIDSALVAAIAVEALGVENVMGVGMPSEYSSEGSKDDARELAERLGMRLEMLPIHTVFGACETTLDPLFAGTPFGLAEENVQSRIRGLLLMALSNKFGALVLTTGNKSEMSVGYSTLYGDMVGALAVIGDVFKTRVYELSRYANREREIIPEATLLKAPSAELRPGQKDTDSLPSYEVLDPILEAYVERYCSAAQIADEQNVDVELVQQVLKLVERSEYKRQQAAPVLKVTRKSFGMGRRFPIAAKMQV